MQLTRGEIGDLITALDAAMDSIQVDMDSNLPPKSVAKAKWSEADRQQETDWKQSLKVFRKLRRKLAQYE
jgi:hypothetical protein